MNETKKKIGKIKSIINYEKKNIILHEILA